MAAVFAGPGGGPRAVAATPAPAVVSGVQSDDQWEIVVFLCMPSTYGCHKSDATEKQKRALQAFLGAMPELTEIRFLDRAAMYESLRHDFAANRPLLKSVTAKELPESFRLRVKQGADRARVVAAVHGRSGVGRVEDLAEFNDGSWADPSDGTVFLCAKGSLTPACVSGRGKANKKAATFREKKAIIAALDRMPGVESYVFQDQRTAYRHFATTYADNEALVAITKVSDMPESYRLTLYPVADWNGVMASLSRLSGVSQVYNQRCSDTKMKLIAEYGFSDMPGSNVLTKKACAPRAG
ncbi:permease-like cell division protein FtsX [Nonomuraea sp. 10N515B]|uniref:permease-like cell division protein FtsX n=1 Tax=Nonomuraea sp. 10N515B TaxID=3457422 RepID=UPI003FCCBA67